MTQATPPVSSPDVIRAGEVMATLNDWRAILFIIAFVLIAEIGVIVWLIIINNAAAKSAAAERAAMAAENRVEREKMWAVADKFGDAADKIGEQTNKLVTELVVLRAVAARVEATADGTSK